MKTILGLSNLWSNLHHPAYRQIFWAEYFNLVRARGMMKMLLQAVVCLIAAACALMLAVIHLLSGRSFHALLSFIMMVILLAITITAILKTKELCSAAVLKAETTVLQGEADRRMRAYGINPDFTPPADPASADDDNDVIIIHGLNDD